MAAQRRGARKRISRIKRENADEKDVEEETDSAGALGQQKLPDKEEFPDRALDRTGVVVYGSNTGTAKECAENLADQVLTMFFSLDCIHRAYIPWFA